MQYEPCTTVSSNWIKSHNDLQVSADETGMLIENNSGALRSLVLNKKGSSSDQYDWLYPLAFEFTVVSIGSARVQFQLKPTGNQLVWHSDLIGASDGDVIRIELTENQGILKKNGVQVGNPQSYDNTPCRFTLLPTSTATTNSSIKIKDLKIYPI